MDGVWSDTTTTTITTTTTFTSTATTTSTAAAAAANDIFMCCPNWSTQPIKKNLNGG